MVHLPFELDIWLEPIVAVGDLTVAAHELLVRPTNGGDLRSWAVRAQVELRQVTSLALRAARTAAVRTTGSLHVNVMPSDLYDPMFSDVVLRTFGSQTAARLVLEVIEDEPLEDRTEVQRSLRRLRSEGIRFAIDDFGDGWADERSAAIVGPEVVKVRLERALEPCVRHRIRLLADEHRASVVVEQVETEAHLTAVRRLGFGYAQGWLWGPSRAANDLLTPLSAVERARRVGPGHRH